jgi:uncharacterized protein (DUF58 family)
LSLATVPAGRARDLLRRIGDLPGSGALATPLRWVGVLLRRVTDLGRLTAATAVVAWVAGWYFGWRELMLVAAAGLVALVAAYLFTLGRANLAVSITLDRGRVVVGQRAVGALEVTNQARSRLLPLRMDTPVGIDTISIEIPSLASAEQFEEVFVVPTTHRAVVQLGPARSIQGDPLGLVRRVVAWNAPVPLYVHPRTERLEGLVNGLIRDLEGRSTNDLSPSDVSFHTLRDYVIGDDRRHVHWRSSARLGKLVVRQFVDTRRSVLGVVLATEQGDYASDEEFELAVSAAGSITLSALAEEQELIFLAGPTLIPAHTPNGILDHLAGVEREGSAPEPQQGPDEAPKAAAPAKRGLAKATELQIATMRRSMRALETASVIAVVTGSGATSEDLRRAASRYGAHAAVIVFRCNLASPASATRTAGNVTVVDIRELGGLRRQVMAGVMS